MSPDFPSQASSNRPVVSSDIQASQSGFQRVLIPAAVVLITCGVFWPATRYGFVNLDDPANFHLNHHYRGFGIENLRWALTTFHFGAYQPLSWLLFSAQYVGWELDGPAYHTVSVLAHAINAMLFYALALVLLRKAMPEASAANPSASRYAAALGALLFAIHPLRVEVVAWVSSQPYLWVGMFYLLSLLAYVRAIDARRRYLWLAASCLAYAASLLSKGVGVGLIGVLVILDVYPLRRLRWSRGGRSVLIGVLAEKLPYLLLAAGSVFMAMRSKSEAMVPTNYDLPHRLALAVWGAAFYLYKTLLPIGLSPWYQMPEGFSIWSWPFVISTIVLVILTAAVLRWTRSFPAFLALWVGYGVVLAPVSHVARLGYQAASDRYTYLSCMGLALLGGAGWLWAVRLRSLGRLHRSQADMVSAAACAVCVVLGLLSRQQIGYWMDDVRLWGRAAAITPDIPMPHSNLGAVLRMRKDFLGAEAELRRAVELDPRSVLARTNLALTLLDQGRSVEALEQCRTVLRTDPDSGEARVLCGMALAAQGDTRGAAEQYRLALTVDPNLGSARLSLARMMCEQGQVAEAIALLRVGAGLLNPDPRVLNMLARMVLSGGRGRTPDAKEALRWADQACKATHRDQPEFLETLAHARLAAGDRAEAADVAREALKKAERTRRLEMVGRLAQFIRTCSGGG